MCGTQEPVAGCRGARGQAAYQHVSSPPLQACYELQQMRLHALERGTLYDLDDLAARHAARHEETRALLEGFSETIVHQAQDACVAAMQLMEDQVMGIKRGAAGQGAHTVPGPGMKAVPAPVPAPVPVPAPAPVANGVTGGDGEGSGGAEGLPSAAAGEADDRSAAGAAADGGGEALGVAGGSTAEDGQGQEQGQEQGEEQLAAQAGAVQVQLLQGPDAAAGDGDGAQSTATGFTAAAASSPGRKGSGGAGAGYARSVAPSFFSPDMVGGDFSYALSAARRSYKRRIHAFVRLLDYMVCGALHELVVESTLDLVDALTPAPVEAKPAAGGRVQAEPAAAAADDTGDLHESVSKAPNEAGEEAVQVEEEQEVAMSWGVDGGNVLKISVCLQAAAGSPTSPSRPGMQAARRAGLSFSSRRSMLASRTTSRTALTAVPEALLAQEDGLEGAGGEQQQALQYGVVLSPPPLEYLSTFSRIQTTWVQQVQSVARLLPHPKLQVGVSGYRNFRWPHAYVQPTTSSSCTRCYLRSLHAMDACCTADRNHTPARSKKLFALCAASAQPPYHIRMAYPRVYPTSSRTTWSGPWTRPPAWTWRASTSCCWARATWTPPTRCWCGCGAPWPRRRSTRGASRTSSECFAVYRALPGRCMEGGQARKRCCVLHKAPWGANIRRPASRQRSAHVQAPEPLVWLSEPRPVP